MASEKVPGDYIQTLNPEGYINNREITNLPGQFLVKGSRDCLIVNKEKVVSSKGYTLVGAAKTKNKGHRGSVDWKTNTNAKRSLRLNTDGELEVWYDSAWRLLKQYVKGTRVEFTTWWSATELIDLLLWVKGDDEIEAWSGGIAEIASATVATLTKKGYFGSSTVAFHDNGVGVRDTIVDTVSDGFVAAGFEAGDTIAITGSADNDGEYLIYSVTADTITLDIDEALTEEALGAAVVVRWPGNGSWAESRFFTAGTRKVSIDGVEYSYSGGETTGTLTGLTIADPSLITAGDLAFQTVRTEAPAALTGMSLDRIGMIYNYVFVGSTKSRLVKISKSSDYTNYSYTALRKTGEGFELTLDSQTTAFIPDEDQMYITAGEDDVYKVSFQLSATTTGDENVTITKLKTATGQAARSQAAVVNIKNAIAFISFEPTIDTLGRIENVQGGPESVPISDAIKDDLEAYDLTDAHGVYYRRNLFFALPAEGIVLIYDMQNQYWQPPQYLPVGRLALIDIDEDGGTTLCGHSSVSNETYKLFDGYNDNGATKTIIMAFGYENFGTRFHEKVFDELATELYISSNTIVTSQVNYDYKGATDLREFTIDGSDEDILFVPNEEGGSLGSAPFGSIPFGSLLDQPDDMAKARIIHETKAKDFFERQRIFYSTTPDARFAVIAYGENIELSDSEPVFIKRS